MNETLSQAESKEKKVVDVQSQIEGDMVVWRKVYEDGSVEGEWHSMNANPSSSESVRNELKGIKQGLGIKEN